MSFLVDYLYPLVAPALLLGMIAMGYRCAARLGLAAIDERLGVALAAGMATCSLLATLLGVFHLLVPVCAVLILLVFTAAGAQWIRKGNGRAVFPTKELGLGRAVLYVCIGICAVNAWFCLSPEIRHDPFDYHLTAANLYTVEGRIVEIPWHVFTYMPKYGEMLYAFVSLLGPDILGKLIHCSAGIGVILLSSALGNRLGGHCTARVSIFLVSLMPIFSFLSTTCYVDLFVAMWGLAAILCLLTSTESDRPWQSLAAGALFLGMVMGTKYVAWVTLVGPVLLSFATDYASRRGIARSILTTGGLFLGAIAVAGPWLLYNLSWTGNPTYPLLGSLFGRHIPACAAAESFFRGHAPPAQALTLAGFFPYLLMRLYRLLVSETLWVFVPGFLAALWLAFRRTTAPTRVPAMVVLFSSAAFFLATDNHDGRFFFTTLCLCAVLTGLLVAQLLERTSQEQTRITLTRAGYLLTAALVIFWIPSRINQAQVFDQKIIPRITTRARETVLRDRFPGFDLVLWANEHLPPDAFVLGLGYPLHRRHISKNKYGYIPWLADEPGLDDPDRLAEVLLRRGGVTHIATPWPDLGYQLDFAALLPSHLAPLRRADGRVLYRLY